MKHTILIVDDSPVFRQLLNVALQQAGYNTIVACDGRDALLQLDHHAVSLVLLDLSTPGKDGLVVLAALRRMPRYKALPVILLTGTAKREYVQRAASLGVHDYLLKSSFSLPELLVRVSKGVSLHAPPGHAPVSLSSFHPQVSHSAPVRAVAHGSGPAGNSAAPGAHHPDSVCATLEPPLATPPEPEGQPAPPEPSAGTRAKARGPVLLTHDQTIARLRKVIASNTAAGVIAQVLALASSPLSEMAELVGVIECDPILAARVLQIANSAAFATAKPTVTSVDEAARNIGFNGIYNIAASFGLFNAFPPDAADGFSSLRCWQHSLAVAAILQQLLADSPESPRGMLHLIGLCHDLGEILLRQHFALEFTKILNVATRCKLPVRQVEATALSLQHHELISLALQQMTFPAAIIKPIAEFFETHHVLRDGSPLARALALANYLAHGMQLATSVHARVRPITMAEWCGIGGDRPILHLDAAALRASVMSTTSVLAHLERPQDAALRRPLLARTQRHVWYVRHKFFCELDPLALAIESLAEVTISDRLPETAMEWDEIDALIIAAPRVGSPPMKFEEIKAAREKAKRTALPTLCLTSDPQQEADKSGIDKSGIIVQQYPVELAELAAFLQ